ncbi:hypothetical protein B0A55_01494 [Friedmanniomyces simplex]|uniref:Uncharacterized protein n=1 Tax=Friedmanniomyces simplex TaxID=329884 RepID=A0A4U0XXL3_9PEZI|nr:hypothetical protein B0A55_01494 [Friedmanniomyces simplex]
MSQPKAYSSSGRLQKKTVFFDDLQAEHHRKAIAVREDKRSPGQGRMQPIKGHDDLVSPSTPTPAPGVPTASQHLPTPVATSSAPISPTTVPPADLISKSTAALARHSVAEKPASGFPSSRNTTASKPPVRTPASSGPRPSRVEKSRKKQQAPPLPPPRRSAIDADLRAAALAAPAIQRLREDRMLLDEAPSQISYLNGREQPTGYASDRYGLVQPLYRDETQVPDGVQRYLAIEPGKSGSGGHMPWEVGGRRSRAGQFVGGASVVDGQHLTALERAAGWGEDPMDAMMTSDEEG